MTRKNAPKTSPAQTSGKDATRMKTATAPQPCTPALSEEATLFAYSLIDYEGHSIEQACEIAGEFYGIDDDRLSIWLVQDWFAEFIDQEHAIRLAEGSAWVPTPIYPDEPIRPRDATGGRGRLSEAERAPTVRAEVMMWPDSPEVAAMKASRHTTQDADMNALRRENHELRTANMYLKAAAALFASDLKDAGLIGDMA